MATEAQFDEWYDEQCSIDAAECVGPNSLEYDLLLDILADDQTRKGAMRIQFEQRYGGIQ